MDISALLMAMSVPSAITGFCFWALEKKMEKREKALSQKEEPEKRMRCL